MAAKYLTKRIVEKKNEPNSNPFAGLTVDGYTKRSGAPSQWMVRLEGENRWRRLMVWQFSNAGTCFVKIGGECLIVNDLPEN